MSLIAPGYFLISALAVALVMDQIITAPRLLILFDFASYIASKLTSPSVVLFESSPEFQKEIKLLIS